MRRRILIILYTTITQLFIALIAYCGNDEKSYTIGRVKSLTLLNYCNAQINIIKVL